ncbi:hypothetical protein J3E68DRAFT_53426 [Trichoderma sp. SZMC 28012]
MGMASRGGQFVCLRLLSASFVAVGAAKQSARSRRVWKVPSNGQPLRCRGIDAGSMDDDGYRRSSLGKKRSSFCGIVKREALTGFAFVWWEREREEASFFFPGQAKKKGRVGSGFVLVLAWGGAWPSLDWTQQCRQGRVASTVIQRIHRLEQPKAGSGRQLIRPSTFGRVPFCATCPSITICYLSIFARH